MFKLVIPILLHIYFANHPSQKEDSVTAYSSLSLANGALSGCYTTLSFLRLPIDMDEDSSCSRATLSRKRRRLRVAEIRPCAPACGPVLERADSRLELHFASPEFAREVAPEAELSVAANVREVVDDSYEKNEKCDRLSWGLGRSQLDGETRMSSPHVYRRGKLSQAADDIFGAEVLLLLRGDWLRSHHSGVFSTSTDPF